MKKISFIIPNFKVENFNIIENKFAEFLKNKYDYQLICIFEGLKAGKNKKDSKNLLIPTGGYKSYSEQITMGFNKAEGDCVIVCDMSVENYEEYLTNLIAKWELGAKIVRLKKDEGEKKFISSIKHFWHSCTNFFIQMFGISKNLFCYNTFQLFDKQVYQIIQGIPEKNAFLRNYEALSTFHNEIVYTDEKIVLPKDKIRWNTNYTIGVILLSLLAVFIGISFVLYPIAKANKAGFTYIAILIFVCLGLLIFGVYCFVRPRIINKIGKEQL